MEKESTRAHSERISVCLQTPTLGPQRKCVHTTRHPLRARLPQFKAATSSQEDEEGGNTRKNVGRERGAEHTKKHAHAKLSAYSHRPPFQYTDVCHSGTTQGGLSVRRE